MEKRKENLSRTKMCRFCLTQTTPLKTLFESNRTTKDCMSLKFKVLSCLSYEVFPSDKMPSYICERCKFFMNTFYEFKKICRQSDEFVLKYVRNGTPFEPLPWPKALLKVYDSAKDIVKTVVDGGTTVQVSSQDTSESEDEDANIYNIQIGDDEEAKTTQIKVVTTNNDLEDSKTSKKGFGSVQKLSQHLRSHAGERPYPCKYCDKSFIKSQHYTRHLRVKHRDEVRGTVNASQPDGDAESYPCEQCEETFGTQDELIFHSAIHATQNLTCPLCQEKFDNVDDVTAHIKSHVNGVEFMCDFCELVFTTKEKYETHLMLAHEEEIQNELGEGESSMDAEGEDDEDVTGIQVTQDGDEMVIEMKKSEADNFMMSQNSQAEYEMKLDNTNSEESEFDTACLETTTDNSPITTQIEEESATIEKISTSIVPTPEPEQTTVLPKPVTILPPQTTLLPNQVTVLSNQLLPSSATVILTQAKIEKTPAVTKDNDHQADVVIRKVEVIRRKNQQPDTQPAKKEKAVRVEGSVSAGFTDKSLRLLEKELQDLKRTNSRSEITKTTSSKTADVSKIRRQQVITSTPKLRTIGDEKKLVYSKSPALERKFERRITKENKEPSLKEGKNNENNKEDEKKEKESKDSPKSVIKNGASDKSNSDEGVRRSTRPSRVRDYAKMVRDRSKDNSDDDDTDTEDDEEYKDANISETRSKRRVSLKTKSPAVTAPASTNPAVTPTPRKRGRPRKDAYKEVPEKIKKDEIASQQDSEEISNIVKKTEIPTISAPTTPIKEETMECDQKSPTNDVILSPSGQALKKVPIKALPPGVKPMPLLMNARSTGQGELCEMQIGKKVVKVQKIVMTKADVEEMARKGLVEMKDGTMILKQGIKLPTSSNALNKDIKETPKKEKGTPTRCDIGND